MIQIISKPVFPPFIATKNGSLYASALFKLWRMLKKEKGKPQYFCSRCDEHLEDSSSAVIKCGALRAALR